MPESFQTVSLKLSDKSLECSGAAVLGNLKQRNGPCWPRFDHLRDPIRNLIRNYQTVSRRRILRTSPVSGSRKFRERACSDHAMSDVGRASARFGW